MNDKLTTRNLTSPTFHHATQTTWRILAFACISCVMASSLFPAQTIEEGFEGSTFPPDGWTVIQNNPNKTWKIAIMDDRSHGGTQYADVERDWPAMDQDEILISPYVEVGGEDKVEFWSKGSLNWGGGEPFDNYDAEIWLVIGEWGGDDVYVGKADDDWIGNFEWSYSSYDLSSLIPEGESEYRVAFRYVGNDGAQFGLDDVVIGKETAATPTPTPTPSLTPTPTLSPTPTVSPTPSPTSSPTPSPTSSPTPSPTSSPTPSPTSSPTPSPTSSPTPSPTLTPTPSPTESFGINYWFLY